MTREVQASCAYILHRFPSFPGNISADDYNWLMIMEQASSSDLRLPIPLLVKEREQLLVRAKEVYEHAKTMVPFPANLDAILTTCRLYRGFHLDVTFSSPERASPDEIGMQIKYEAKRNRESYLFAEMRLQTKRNEESNPLRSIVEKEITPFCEKHDILVYFK